ncbi:MAG TPA: hypothetical protein VG407_07350 [Caulobacteraceae bacterium]|jgi:hypothetical protein|nr:hypothetical protein [Caulobacteraceae bacterium]
MKVISAADVAPFDWNADGRSSRKGSYPSQRLFTEEAPDGLNFVFVRNEFIYSGDAAFETPRHRHTFAQVKFIAQGQSNYAPGQDIGEGEIGYFPRMAYYGPQHKEACTSMVIQYGFDGEHQKGPVWEGYRAEAIERLKARGTIKDGRYFETDPATGGSRVRDGVEAIYEEQYLMHTGKALPTPPPPGYDAVILMKPKAFPWFDVSPGVQMKRLGAFFDQPGPNGDTRISMLRLSGGAYALSADRAQLCWALEPGLVAENRMRPEITTAYCPRGEEGTLAGEGGLEVFVVDFPRRD